MPATSEEAQLIEQVGHVIDHYIDDSDIAHRNLEAILVEWARVSAPDLHAAYKRAKCDTIRVSGGWYYS